MGRVKSHVASPWFSQSIWYSPVFSGAKLNLHQSSSIFTSEILENQGCCCPFFRVPNKSPRINGWKGVCSTSGESMVPNCSSQKNWRSLCPKWWFPKSWGYPKISKWMIYDIYLLENPTSSTAQGGGWSFKNRKPIGDAGCCESRMAERSHWWTERWLRSLSLSLFFSDYPSI